MEARKMEKIDPREYIYLLEKTYNNRIHLPYSSLNDYFYDLRKRADKFISKFSIKFSIKNLDGIVLPSKFKLSDCIIEYHNMAIHYLCYLIQIKEGSSISIPPYNYSDSGYP